MKTLRVIFECIRLYFVYKKLNRQGFVNTNYGLIALLSIGLRHKESIYNNVLEPFRLNKKKEEFNEKKQSEKKTVC